MLKSPFWKVPAIIVEISKAAFGSPEVLGKGDVASTRSLQTTLTLGYLPEIRDTALLKIRRSGYGLINVVLLR